MTTIISKNSSTAGAVPIAGDLVQGEIAVNVTDKKLYTKNASGSVVQITPVVNDNGFKNRIINGQLLINQRVVSGTVTLAAGVYGHDRFKAGASGCTYTFATSNNVTTLTITAGSLIQVVEGLNLESGTYTLSWTGTVQGKIGAGSFSASGVTGSITGGTNTNIEFNTGTLSLPQLEKGSTATSFDYRPYGTELALCQRYYEVGASKTFIQGGSGLTFPTSYHVSKRASGATIITGTSPAGTTVAPTSIDYSGIDSFWVFKNTGGEMAFSWTSASEL